MTTGDCYCIGDRVDPNCTWHDHATVDRIAAKSGNRDNDFFRAACTCGWQGGMHSNRTAEGRRLADRDADNHKCAT